MSMCMIAFNMLILVLLTNIVLQDSAAKPHLAVSFFTYADFSSYYLPPISQGWYKGEFPADVPVNCPRGDIAFSIGLEMKDYDVLNRPIIIFDMSFSVGRDVGGGRKTMSNIYGYPAFSEVKTDILFLGGGIAVLIPFGSMNKNGEKKYCAGGHILLGGGIKGETSLNVKVLKNDTEVSIYENNGSITFFGVGPSFGWNTSFTTVLLNIGFQIAGPRFISIYNKPLENTTTLGELGGMYVGLSFKKNLFHCFDWHYQSSASKK